MQDQIVSTTNTPKTRSHLDAATSIIANGRRGPTSDARAVIAVAMDFDHAAGRITPGSMVTLPVTGL